MHVKMEVSLKKKYPFLQSWRCKATTFEVHRNVFVLEVNEFADLPKKSVIVIITFFCRIWMSLPVLFTDLPVVARMMPWTILHICQVWTVSMIYLFIYLHFSMYSLNTVLNKCLFHSLNQPHFKKLFFQIITRTSSKTLKEVILCWYCMFL